MIRHMLIASLAGMALGGAAGYMAGRKSDKDEYADEMYAGQGGYVHGYQGEQAGYGQGYPVPGYPNQ